MSDTPTVTFAITLPLETKYRLDAFSAARNSPLNNSAAILIEKGLASYLEHAPHSFAERYLALSKNRGTTP